MSVDSDQRNQLPLGPGTVLSELDAESRAAIGQLAVRRTYEKGEMVCLEGEPCPGLIIVETGWISSVKLSPQGREQEIRVAGSGEMINEISVMAGNTNQTTLKSLTKSNIWVINQKVLNTLLAKYPNLSSLITKKLAQRVVQLLDLVGDLALRNVEGRLAHLLLSRSTNGIMARRPWETETEMAANIGTTSVIISRILGEMQNQGAIRLSHNQIQILDQALLESLILGSNK